jgi:hypothetical protein
VDGAHRREELGSGGSSDLAREGFSGEPEWTMGFVWDEDSVMRA